MRSSGFCPRCALCVPKPVFTVLYILFNLGLMGLGGFIVKLGIDAVGASSARFISIGLFHMAFAGGGALCLLGLYGLFGPFCCSGQTQDHVKYFVSFSTLLMLMLAVVMVLSMLNADDQDGITEALDFGWQKRYNVQTQHSVIANAQTEHNCCGFGRQQDRKVTPCPAGAGRGCEFRLRKEYAKHLNKLANYELYGVGACFLTIVVGYCYAQHLDLMDAQSTLNNSIRDQKKGDAPHTEPQLEPGIQAPLTVFNSSGFRQRSSV